MLNKRGKQLRASSYVVVCVLMGVLGALLVISWVSAFQGPGVEIGPDHTRQAHVGDTVLYDHTLTNTGTTTDTFTLEVLSRRGWPVELVGATQPAGTLSLQVAAQMTAPFQIRLAVPAGTLGLTDTTVVTATSQLSPTVQDTASDTTIVVPHRLIFPYVVKRWPPVPYLAALNSIDNTDGDGFYTVSWIPAELAETHVLEEDDNASFTSPTIVYNSPGTSWSVPSPGKSPGTYYYRVRGHNQWGYGMYSNIQAVTVSPFRAANTSLQVGQCTTLSWDFTGIKGLHIVFGYGYDKEPVNGQGSRQVCPSVSTTYKAIVTKLDNTEETHQITVSVNGTGCSDPIVWYFAPTTYSVRAGEKFSVFWYVECAKAVWFIIGSGADQPAQGLDSRIDVIIYSTTTFKLKIEKRSGGFVYASFTIQVR